MRDMEDWHADQFGNKLDALICALDGIAQNKVTISYYDWLSLRRAQACCDPQQGLDALILRQINGLPNA